MRSGADRRIRRRRTTSSTSTRPVVRRPVPASQERSVVGSGDRPCEADRPHDPLVAVRHNQDDGLARQHPCGFGRPATEVLADGEERWRLGSAVEGLAEQVNPATLVPGVRGVPAELGPSEVDRLSSTRELGTWAVGEERPDVEVFDAVGSVCVVERAALAEGDGEQALAERMQVRLSAEQVGEVSER